MGCVNGKEPKEDVRPPVVKGHPPTIPAAPVVVEQKSTVDAHAPSKEIASTNSDHPISSSISHTANDKASQGSKSTPEAEGTAVVAAEAKDPPVAEKKEESLPVTEEVPGIEEDGHVLTVDVPGGGYKISVASLTKRGYYPEAPDKANQDSFLVSPVFGGDPNDHLFGVFDGHGEHGTPCSQFTRDRTGQNLLRHRLFKTDVPQAFHGAFVSANAQLHRAPIDDTMSGTTGIVVLLRNRMLYAANVGDSRAVIAERRGKKLVAVDLSNDQTPYREDECARVRACGARVLTLDQLEGLKNPHIKVWGGDDDDEGDPPRLWVPNGMYPGTAFTRSVGDTVAERIGVTAVPEVLVLPLTEHHSFIVVASDGVFEFLSSQAVVDMVAKHKNPFEACKALVDESYRLWLQYETRTDDITIIVIKLEGLNGPMPKPPSSLPPAGATPPGLLGKSLRKPIEGTPTSEKALEGWTPPSREEDKGHKQDRSRLESTLKSNFLFQSLSEEQRSILVASMQLITVGPGDVVIRQGETGDKFYCCEEGEYEILVSLDDTLGSVVHRYTSGSRPSFGDLALLYETRREASVRAATRGSLWTLDRTAFKSVQRMGIHGSKVDAPANPLQYLDDRLSEIQEREEEDAVKQQLGDTLMTQLDWEESVVEHECFQLGRVRHKKTGGILSLRQWHKGSVTHLKRSQQPLLEKKLFALLSKSPFIPTLLSTPSNQSHAGLLLDTRIAVPLTSLFTEPLPSQIVKYIAASVTQALVDLHQSDVLFRGVAPDTIFIDDKGWIQLADLRFAKPLAGGRTFTMCGVPDFLAPEIIAGVGHDFSADWWALGVLIYTLLVGQSPFGTWKDSELQIYTRIMKRQFQFHPLLVDAADLVDKLLTLKPENRLGSTEEGVAAIKEHPFFSEINWEELSGKQVSAPSDLLDRLSQARKRLPLGDRGTARKAEQETQESEATWFDGW